MPDVILPCLDEAAALRWVLSLMPRGHQAIVADNGSTDGSASIARDHGATVVDAVPRGLGGSAHARHGNADLVGRPRRVVGVLRHDSDPVRAAGGGRRAESKVTGTMRVVRDISGCWPDDEGPAAGRGHGRRAGEGAALSTVHP